MSSHRSQRSTNLHHDQVNTGKARREQRHTDRLQNFLEMRKQLRQDYDCILCFGFICFAYTAIATSVYLRYIL